MSILYMTVGTIMGFAASLMSLLNGASAAKAFVTYSAFGSFAILLLALAFFCASVVEDRVRSRS